jgi:hypothetical protein
MDIQSVRLLYEHLNEKYTILITLANERVCMMMELFSEKSREIGPL